MTRETREQDVWEKVNSAWGIDLEQSSLFRLALFYHLTKPELKELALVLKHRILIWGQERAWRGSSFESPTIMCKITCAHLPKERLPSYH